MKTWISLLYLLVLTPTVSANPIYYTFEGTIDNITVGSQGGVNDPYEQDILNFAYDRGFTIGTEVSYTMMIDKNQPGTSTSSNGDIRTYQMASSNTFNSYEIYSNELVDGEVLGGYPMSHDFVSSHTRINPSTLELEAGYPNTTFWAGDYIGISNSQTSNNLLNDLFIGESFLFSNKYLGSTAGNSLHFGDINGSLKLTNISNSFSVSEPAPLILLLTGITALLISTRKNLQVSAYTY